VCVCVCVVVVGALPQVPGSESGAANMTLDMRNFLTPSLAKKIPPHQIPKPFYLNAFEDLPPAWDRTPNPNPSHPAHPRAPTHLRIARPVTPQHRVCRPF